MEPLAQQGSWLGFRGRGGHSVGPVAVDGKDKWGMRANHILTRGPSQLELHCTVVSAISCWGCGPLSSDQFDSRVHHPTPIFSNISKILTIINIQNYTFFFILSILSFFFFFSFIWEIRYLYPLIYYVWTIKVANCDSERSFSVNVAMILNILEICHIWYTNTLI